MSMPIIKDSDIKRCQAITDIIESVALEQTGLSHILNAEGEKIQAFLAIKSDKDMNNDNNDKEDLLKINKSVQKMVRSITILETVLQSKLELFEDCLCEECHDRWPTEPEVQK